MSVYLVIIGGNVIPDFIFKRIPGLPCVFSLQRKRILSKGVP